MGEVPAKKRKLTTFYEWNSKGTRFDTSDRFWLWLCPSSLRSEGQTDELETYRSIYYKIKGINLSQIHWLFYPTRIRLPLFQVRCRWRLHIMVKMMCLICPRVNMIIRLSCLRRWAQVTDRSTSGLMKLHVICCKTYGNFIILPRYYKHQKVWT